MGKIELTWLATNSAYTIGVTRSVLLALEVTSILSLTFAELIKFAPQAMRYRAPRVVLIFSCLILFISTFSCLVHKSTDYIVPCSSFDAGNSENAPAFLESYLLTEGESLSLDCGVCRYCNGSPADCWEHTDITEWHIQRTRYLGYGGDIKGYTEESSSDLNKIRRR